jgi:two-component system chemotaxis response regulator CheB
MTRAIKVLIVDDSAFMRKALTNMLQSEGEIEIIATARNGNEAVDKIFTLKPDVVTLDMEMPGMNGLEVLQIIMEQMPLPVLVVSSLTNEGAQITLDALDLGAIDFIPKNLADVSLNIFKIKEDLITKIKSIARKRPSLFRPKKIKPIPITTKKMGLTHRKVGVVAIGTSTGGPKALQEILIRLPADFPTGIVIVQHMPAAFTGPFANRLDQLSAIKVKEAESSDTVQAGLALLAPGNLHLKLVRKKATEVNLELSPHPNHLPHCPSVDVMMTSVAAVYPGRCIGVILTGMGHDGQEGMSQIKQTKGRSIAQDEESCVVFGMPKAAIEAGAIDKVVPLSDIAGELINMV